MRFIQIPRKFQKQTEGTKFIDVLVYAIIALHKDSVSGKSRIGMRTISEKYNIALSKVEAAIDRLKTNGYINYIKLESKVSDYLFNEYSFPEIKDFLMLKPELLTEDLKPKDRGILIYLQLACEYKSNTIRETTIEGLANRIGITRQTMSKYLKYFLDNNYISKPELYYRCKYLAKDSVIKEPEHFELLL